MVFSKPWRHHLLICCSSLVQVWLLKNCFCPLPKFLTVVSSLLSLRLTKLCFFFLLQYNFYIGLSDYTVYIIQTKIVFLKKGRNCFDFLKRKRQSHSVFHSLSRDTLCVRFPVFPLWNYPHCSGNRIIILLLLSHTKCLYNLSLYPLSSCMKRKREREAQPNKNFRLNKIS